MKYLNGKELADYVKARQIHEVRRLRQYDKIIPRLAIVAANRDPVIETYMRLKRAFAMDILVEIDTHMLPQNQVADKLHELNDDQLVTGIILQLPLSDSSQTDQLVNIIAPEKDVDGMTKNSQFDPATAVAINWLLNGYGIELKGKKIVIIGRGRLVGEPLSRMWSNSGLNVTALGRDADLTAELADAEIIVSATGVPGILTSDIVPPGAVVVDAGTADEDGKIAGDASAELYRRDDLTITPTTGGVGPLTIAALYDNVIRACKNNNIIV